MNILTPIVSTVATGEVYLAIVVAVVILIIWAFITHSKMKDLEPLRTSTSEIVKGLDMLRSIGEKVTRIEAMLEKKQVTESSSPVILNEYGKKLSKKINAPTLVEAYVDKLVKEWVDMNAYEIQQKSFDFVQGELLSGLRMSSPETYNRISQLAFVEGMSIENLMRVLGIELRDQILHKLGKAYEDIDHFAPDK